MQPRIVARREVFKTPYFALVAKEVAGACPGDPYYAIQTLDYVVTFAITPAEEVVLVKQFRPVVESVCLELPSGHVEPGEPPGISARRELFEETGYTADAFDLVSHANPDLGRLENRMWVFFARGAHPSPESWTPEAGVERVICPAAEFRQHLKNGRFDHALHLAALLMVLLHRKLPIGFLVQV
jgi:8-oxo-dGTP pyrophosphatase MutT (NUDIX family)